jgi:hypothetical protein
VNFLCFWNAKWFLFFQLNRECFENVKPSTTKSFSISDFKYSLFYNYLDIFFLIAIIRNWSNVLAKDWKKFHLSIDDVSIKIIWHHFVRLFSDGRKTCVLFYNFITFIYKTRHCSWSFNLNVLFDSVDSLLQIDFET